MKYLALIATVIAITSCQHLKKSSKHNNQSSTNKIKKKLPFSGDIIKIKNRDVIKASSNNPNAFIMIGNCGISPYQAFNRDKSKVAIICSNEYFNSLYVIDLIADKAHKISQFNRKKNKYYYTFAWSGNGKLFFGYEDHVKLDSVYTSKHGEVIAYNVNNRLKRNVGCSVSKRVIANIDTNRLAVSAGMDSRYVYIVKKSDCATVQRFRTKNKRGITFSPDGNHYAYFNQKGNLWVNSLKNDEKILLAKEKVDPDNIRWSPDGSKLSFDEIASKKTGSRQVVIYSAATDTTIRTEKPSMVSNNEFTNAFWSPNGNLLIYQSSLTRFNGDIDKELHLYSVADQKVVNTFEISPVNIASIRLRGWVDNRHILLSKPNSGLSLIKINKDYRFRTVKANQLPRPYSAYISVSVK